MLYTFNKNTAEICLMQLAYFNLTIPVSKNMIIQIEFYTVQFQFKTIRQQSQFE